jgi:hypothetical protein
MATRYENTRLDTDRYRDDGRRSTAAPFIGLGGLILLIGSFLPWASDSGTARTINESISGSSFPDGRMAMGLGFAMLLIAVVMSTTRRAGSWFDADLLGFALGTIAVVTTVATLAALGSNGVDNVSRSAEIGLYVAIAGALIGMVGALVGLVRSASDRATEDRRGGVVGTERAA